MKRQALILSSIYLIIMCLGYIWCYPFFKIENDYYMIKGVQGKDYFRIAVHGKHEDELQRLEEFLYSGQKKE